MTILLVPNEFLRPEPALLPHSENQFDDVRVTFPADDFFFDVEDESATRFENTQKLLRT